VILGIGADLLETGRVRHELGRSQWLPDDGIFTPEEISDCSSAARPALGFAACFAAKEAALKALGMPVTDLGLFREVTVAHDDRGRRRVMFSGRLKAESDRLGVRNIKLSLVYNPRQTCAIIILES